VWCTREATIQVSARAAQTISKAISNANGTATKAPRRTAATTSTKSHGSGGRVRYNVAPLPDPPKIERRKSRVHGWGVFALETIPKNKRIIDYAGEKITARQSTPREVRYLKQGHIWCFTLNRNWAIDAAVDGNAARFINHSCRGNCYVQILKGVIWIRAARTIRKGEELSYNYHTDGAAEIPCRCRPGCQGML
jgi:SET domain-containing protein